MRYSEFQPPFKGYQVMIRLKSGMTGQTLVFAKHAAFARELARALYGDRNLISIIVIDELDENQTTPKPIDPEQQRIQALSNQKQQISQQIKNVRAQSKLKKAQKAMQSVRAIK